MSKSRNTKYDNRYYDYDDEYVDTRKERGRDKSKERRFERALKTKNIRDLVEEDEEDADVQLSRH
jgi:hypothetical protein